MVPSLRPIDGKRFLSFFHPFGDDTLFNGGIHALEDLFLLTFSRNAALEPFSLF